MIQKKVCLLGDFAVGKTSLVRRFVDRQFSDQYLSTVGVKISRKLLDYSISGDEDRQLQVVLWDIEGSTEFKGIPSSYIQGAHGAVVVGDLSRKETLRHVELHIAQFLSANPSAYVVVALNKADLTGNHPDLSQFENTSEKILVVVKTSAKTGDGVDRLFDSLGRQLISA